MRNNVAIDGPAGAGKSTIAKKIAKDKGYIYVDTGAMYRAMGLYVLRNDVNGEDEDAVNAICDQVEISIAYENNEQIVYLFDENINDYLRTEEVGKMASKVATYPKVRLKLVELQRELASKQNVVMDGRDIGTYVLPNANTKIFLTASSFVRAQRRYKELTEKGFDCDIEEIEEEIIKRDKQDSEREMAPLKQAEDAILVDTSDLSIDEVVERIKEIIE
jgi:cytidylate kinase